MRKIGLVAVVCFLVGICYLLMLVVMPVATDLAATSNATMQASSNMTLYPGAAESVVAMPWVMWFAPGVIGMAVIVFILKKD